MKYPLSGKYRTPELMAKMMGPNPLMLEEELMAGHRIPAGSTVCDLGSGQGLTSVFLVKEYGMKVYAADLWSDPEDNRRFFDQTGLSREQIIPVRADAADLPFEREFFDAVVSTDSYHYFGRDPDFLDTKLLPFVKPGGYIHIAVPGMRKDCRDHIPDVLLLSFTPQDPETFHDAEWWAELPGRSKDAEILNVSPMETHMEAWEDWLLQENDHAVGDRKSMRAGGGKYLNFVRMDLRKKEA